MNAQKHLSSVGIALVLGAMVSASAPVFAQTASPGSDSTDTSPYYIALSIGSQSREDAKDISGPATKFKTGYVASFAVGRYVGKIVRVEAEANTFNNANDKEFVPAAVGTALATGDKASGNITLQTYMFNVYGDIPIKKSPRFKPYVGAGLGLFQSQVHGLTSTLLSTAGETGNPLQPFGGQDFVLDTSSDFGTAYQLKIGAAFKADPKTDITIDYRRFFGDRFKLQTNNAFIGHTLDVSGPRVSVVEVGVRIGI
jgi:outer membrane protein W